MFEIIFNFPRISRYKVFISTIAIFKLSKCEESHIPTFILNNMTNLLSNMLVPLLHMEVLDQQDARMY